MMTDQEKKDLVKQGLDFVRQAILKAKNDDDKSDLPSALMVLGLMTGELE